jgi:hypothetical protein
VSAEQPLREVSVDLDELCAAFNDASSELRYFLDTETGEMILVSDMLDQDEMQQQLAEIDAADMGRYLAVPLADSHKAYRDMEDFIATVRDEPLQDLLSLAIQGRGAFRRFKDVLLGHPETRQRWFDFEAARLEARVRQWLADEGCAPVSRGIGEPNASLDTGHTL